MKVCFDVSPTGVTTRGLRLRCIEAADVRRVHLFTDANGEVGIVVRKSLWRFVHLPADALRDPALLTQVQGLLANVRHSATVDPQVDELLAAVSDDTTVFVHAA